MFNFKIHKKNNIEFCELSSNDFVVKETQDILNLMANASSGILLIPKENIDEKFFDLSTGLAGEVLQKVSNYRFKVGIIGDFSCYESKSLKDFIYESNKNRQVVFVESTEKAIDLLS